MKLIEAKQQFINSWGAFGTHWGINRTMAQIHALLLVSPDPMTQDDIMDELNISRGNTNMNIRPMLQLLDKLEEVDGDKKDRHVKTFIDTVSGIKKLGKQADKTLDAMVKADEHWFLGMMMKFFK